MVCDIKHVTLLEKFRRCEASAFSGQWDTQAALLESITGAFQGNEKTRIGTAFHALIENGSPDKYLEQDGRLVHVSQGYAFTEAQAALAYNHKASLPGMICEVPISKVYTSRYSRITEGSYEAGRDTFKISGRVDGLHGLTVRDTKLSFSGGTAEQYLASYQWRFYLDMLGLKSFCYDIFHVRGLRDNEPLPYIYDADGTAYVDLSGLEFSGPEEIKCFAYADMSADILTLISRFAAWLEYHELWHLFKITQAENEKANTANAPAGEQVPTAPNCGTVSTPTAPNTGRSGSEAAAKEGDAAGGLPELLQPEEPIREEGGRGGDKPLLGRSGDSNERNGNVFDSGGNDKGAALIFERPICFLDIETTGPDREVDRIFELSIIKLHPDERRESRTWRVKPPIPICASAEAVTGVKTGDVADAPAFRDIAANVSKFIHGCDLAGYNSNIFDLRILQRELEGCGLKLDYQGKNLIDACNIFKIMEARTLTAAVRFYTGKDHEGAHGAEADTNATIDVLLAQLKRYPELPRTAKGLALFSNYGKPMLDLAGCFTVNADGEIIVNFGKKCKGQLASDNLSFLEWMIKTPGFSEDSLYVCKNILGRLKR